MKLIALLVLAALAGCQGAQLVSKPIEPGQPAVDDVVPPKPGQVPWGTIIASVATAAGTIAAAHYGNKSFDEGVKRGGTGEVKP